MEKKFTWNDMKTFAFQCMTKLMSKQRDELDVPVIDNMDLCRIDNILKEFENDKEIQKPTCEVRNTLDKKM